MELEEQLVALLQKHGLTLAVAESCTGGLLAGRIVNVSGVSRCFKAGFVTYTEEAKQKLLSVRKETLAKHTAVSEKTAEEMVLGAVSQMDATVGIATTGLAGPNGGTQEKPVGLVYISTYVNHKVTVLEYHFNGNRNDIREEAVKAALAQTIELIHTAY